MRYNSYTTATRTTAFAFLGTTPDACVATQMHIPVSTLTHWRLKAKIAPHRLHGSTARYRELLRSNPAGLTARQIQDTLGITRQGAFFMLHALARRNIVECVMLPHPQRHSGRAHILRWHLIPEKGAEPHA